MMVDFRATASPAGCSCATTGDVDGDLRARTDRRLRTRTRGAVARTTRAVPERRATSKPSSRRTSAMCLAVVALDAHPRYALVVAANRDEFHARAARPRTGATAAPFAGMLAGRDSWPAARGSACGARRAGRFVTNVREPARNDPAAPSRGELVPAVLNARHAPTARAGCASTRNAAHLQRLQPARRRRARASWVSNRARHARRCGQRRPRPVQRAARHAVAEGRRARRQRWPRGPRRRATTSRRCSRARRSHAGAGCTRCRRPASRSNGSGCCRRRSSSATLRHALLDGAGDRPRRPARASSSARSMRAVARSRRGPFRVRRRDRKA